MRKLELCRIDSAVAAVFGFAVMYAGVAVAAETPLVRGAEKAVAVAESVEGREEVKLVATIGPDTYDFDQKSAHSAACSRKTASYPRSAAASASL